MPLTDRGRRLGAIAGIVFVILALVAIFLPGSPPKADELNNEFTQFITDNRSKILAGDYVLGVGVALFLLFLAALRSHLGARDEDRTLSNAATLGGSVGAALLLAGAALTNGVAFKAAEAGDDALNRALADTAANLFVVGGFAFALFFTAAGLVAAANGTLPGWLAGAGPVVGLLHLVAGIALFAKSGFLANGGVYGFIPPLASLLWVLAASAFMFRGEAAAAAPPVGGTRIADRPAP